MDPTIFRPRERRGREEREKGRDRGREREREKVPRKCCCAEFYEYGLMFCLLPTESTLVIARISLRV
jgi:hypothetical protein